MKIYELENNSILTSTQLKEEAGVSGLGNIDIKEVMNLVSSGKYMSFDEVIITEKTPTELLNKFNQEHLHEDDEVRYFLEGNCIFDVRGSRDQWIRIEVQTKDFITVPKNLYHRFAVPNKKAKAIRLFSNKEGWIPIYRNILNQ